MTALILALALTGQAPSYNLIVNPPAPAPVAAAPVAVDYRITEHAQLQAEVRSYRAALDEADVQIRQLQRQVKQVKAEQTSARARFASETTQDEAPAYRAQPSLATVQVTAPPILASSQLTYSAPATYTTAAPMFVPATYSSFSAAPVTYSSFSAAPVTYSMGAPVAGFGSGASTYRSSVRTGLFGGLRQNTRATSFGASSGVFGVGTVCTTGTCQ